MTLIEAKQYESQGWPHKHNWKPEKWPFDENEYHGIKRYRCSCQAVMIQRGYFQHILYYDGGIVV